MEKVLLTLPPTIAYVMPMGVSTSVAYTTKMTTGTDAVSSTVTDPMKLTKTGGLSFIGVIVMFIVEVSEREGIPLSLHTNVRVFTVM